MSAQALRAQRYPAAEWAYMPTHRTVLCLDVERFARPEHDDLAQVRIRAVLYLALLRVLGRLPAVPGPSRYEVFDRGDGAVVLIRPEIPVEAVVRLVAKRFPIDLSSANARLGHRTRVRIAMHEGPVIYDRYGPVGTTINVACRMQEADPVRACLAASTGDVVLIVSDSVYEDHVLTGGSGLDPAGFEGVPVLVKETRTHGWLRDCAE